SAELGLRLGELGMGEDAIALPAPVIPRPVFRGPPLDSVPEELKVDDQPPTSTDLADVLAIAGWALLAGQFDHLIDPDSASGLLSVLDRLEPRVGPCEDLVPLVIEVGTPVDVIKAWQAGVLCPEPMSANGGLLQVLGMHYP